MKDWLLMFCLAVIALLAYREWAARAPPAPAPVPAPPPVAEIPRPAPVETTASPAPTLPPLVEFTPPPAPAPVPSEAEFAARVADARKLALAKYPDLGKIGTPLNQRFVARYQQLAAFQNPLLRDPAWPMRLADECAAIPTAATAAAPTPAPAANNPPRLAASFPGSRPPLPGPPPVPILAPVAPTPTPGNDQEPLIALDVRSMNAGGTFVVNWLTDYGSYDVSGRANKALDLDAKNLSAHASKVTLQWVFTARGPTRGKRFIFDMGSSDWDMKPNQAVHFGVRSADLTHRSIWYSGWGQGYYQGSEIEGWIVAVRFHDKIIRSLGSSGTLEGMVGTDDFKDMVMAYSKAGASHHGAASTVTNAPWW